MPALLVAFLAATVAIHPTIRFVRLAICRDGGVAVGLRRRGAGCRRDLGRPRPVDRVGHGGRQCARREHDERRRLWQSLFLAIVVLDRGRGDRRRQRLDGHCLPGSRRHRDADHRLYLGRRRAPDTREAGRRRPSRIPQSWHGHAHDRVAVQFADSAGCGAGRDMDSGPHVEDRPAHLRNRQRRDRRVSERRQRQACSGSAPTSFPDCSAQSGAWG